MDMNVMFQQVSDPGTTKIGDIIYWPAEKGKVMHLHGSASTMRGLGFSVGNRYCGTDYGNLKQLFQRDPDKDRLLIVSNIIRTCPRRTASNALTQTLFTNTIAEIQEQTEDPAYVVEVTELPYDIPDDASDSDTLFRLLTYNLIPSWVTSLFADETLDYTRFIPDSKTQLVLQGVHEFLSPETYGSPMRLHEGWWSREPNGSEKFNYLASVTSATKNKDGKVQTDHRIPDNMVANMPVRVIANAAKYGVKLLRPTEEFKKLYAGKISDYVIKRTCEQQETFLAQAIKFMEDLKAEIAQSKQAIKSIKAIDRKIVNITDTAYGKFKKFVEGGMK